MSTSTTYFAVAQGMPAAQLRTPRHFHHMPRQVRNAVFFPPIRPTQAQQNISSPEKNRRSASTNFTLRRHCAPFDRQPDAKPSSLYLAFCDVTLPSAIPNPYIGSGLHLRSYKRRADEGLSIDYVDSDSEDSERVAPPPNAGPKLKVNVTGGTGVSSATYEKKVRHLLLRQAQSVKRPDAQRTLLSPDLFRYFSPFKGSYKIVNKKILWKLPVQQDPAAVHAKLRLGLNNKSVMTTPSLPSAVQKKGHSMSEDQPARRDSSTLSLGHVLLFRFLNTQ